MTNLKALGIALFGSNIAHKATATQDPSMEDDSVEITQKSSDGREINIQVAHDETPRGQPDYIIGLFDSQGMEESFSTHNPYVVTKKIRELF